MKICMLADAGSVHTRRWAGAMSERGHAVTILSLRPGDLEGVTVIDLSPPRWLNKLGYLTAIGEVRARLRQIQPDLLHAHYATSYGLLGALSGFRPLMISAWGADVFDFPRRSALNTTLLRFNFGRADIIACTSRFMKAEVERYTEHAVEVTPFGVDTAQFSPAPGGDRRGRSGVTIGLVKALEEKYGVMVLIEAFEVLAARHAGVRLVIVGDGSQRDSIHAAIERGAFGDRIRLLPAVPHAEVPGLLHDMDIFAVPSVADSESFGVAAIEASACGLPVVASCVGGLPEVVVDGETGVLVPPRDPQALAAALERLVESADLRRTLGAKGRARVERVYDWSDSVDAMERLYTRLASRTPNPGRMPRVAIVTSRAPHGFQERFVLREAEALSRLDLEPILVPVRPPVSRNGTSTRLRTVVLGLASPGSLLAVLRLAARPAALGRVIGIILSDRRPRVLMKNVATLPLACHLARFARRAGIVHLHAAWASTPATVAMLAAELAATPWSFSAHRWDITEANLVRAKLASASFARTVSERGGRELADAAGRGEWSSRIVCLHLGVNVRAVLPREPRGDRPFTVVSVGNLIEKKGHSHLVHAAAILRDRGVDLTVRVVGEGPERLRLEALIDRLGLAGTVRLEGRFSGADVDRLLVNATDLFVQPSVVSTSGEYEGIPVALIEAMAAGCPVVATRSGSIDELVTDDTGLMVPPADPAALAEAIERISADPEFAARLGAAARARVAADFDESDASAELARLILASAQSPGA